MIKRGHFVASLKPMLGLKVELKNVHSFEDAIRVPREKEWKNKRLIQLSLPEEPKNLVNHSEVIKAYVEKEPRSSMVSEDSLRKELQSAINV